MADLLNGEQQIDGQESFYTEKSKIINHFRERIPMAGKKQFDHTFSGIPARLPPCSECDFTGLSQFSILHSGYLKKHFVFWIFFPVEREN